MKQCKNCQEKEKELRYFDKMLCLFIIATVLFFGLFLYEINKPIKSSLGQIPDDYNIVNATECHNETAYNICVILPNKLCELREVNKTICTQTNQTYTETCLEWDYVAGNFCRGDFCNAEKVCTKLSQTYVLEKK